MRFFRSTTKADAQALEALYRELMPYATITIDPEQVARISTNPAAALLVCEEHGEILATALINICEDIAFGTQPFALIDRFIVAQDYRREGIGKSLIDHIEALAAERNCSRIVLSVPAERSQARDFFTAMGFDPDEMLGFIKHQKYFAGSDR